MSTERNGKLRQITACLDKSSVSSVIVKSTAPSKKKKASSAAAFLSVFLLLLSLSPRPMKEHQRRRCLEIKFPIITII